MKELDKIYFLAGDLVVLNKTELQSPIMLVVGKVSTIIRSDESQSKDNLIGIKCRWFTKDNHLQEAVWNTKDLKLYGR